MYTKTKILIFNKTGRFIQENVLFNVFNIMYKCLGIPFTASSSTAQDEQTLFISQNFEHTITPVILYGSGTWRPFSPFSSKFRKEKSVIDILKILKCEKLHTKF